MAAVPVRFQVRQVAGLILASVQTGLDGFSGLGFPVFLNIAGGGIQQAPFNLGAIQHASAHKLTEVECGSVQGLVLLPVRGQGHGLAFVIQGLGCVGVPGRCRRSSSWGSGATMPGLLFGLVRAASRNENTASGKSATMSLPFHSRGLPSVADRRRAVRLQLLAVPPDPDLQAGQLGQLDDALAVAGKPGIVAKDMMRASG